MVIPAGSEDRRDTKSFKRIDIPKMKGRSIPPYARPAKSEEPVKDFPIPESIKYAPSSIDDFKLLQELKARKNTGAQRLEAFDITLDEQKIDALDLNSLNARNLDETFRLLAELIKPGSKSLSDLWNSTDKIKQNSDPTLFHQKEKTLEAINKAFTSDPKLKIALSVIRTLGFNPYEELDSARNSIEIKEGESFTLANLYKIFEELSDTGYEALINLNEGLEYENFDRSAGTYDSQNNVSKKKLKVGTPIEEFSPLQMIKDKLALAKESEIIENTEFEKLMALATIKIVKRPKSAGTRNLINGLSEQYDLSSAIKFIRSKLKA